MSKIPQEPEKVLVEAFKEGLKAGLLAQSKPQPEDKTSSLFQTGIRPVIDDWLLKKSKEVREGYNDHWPASSAGYCQRKVIFERLGVPPVTEDARKQRVFTSGHIFHEWIQGITKEAGLSIAQELELRGLIGKAKVLGHIDDLVLVPNPINKQIVKEALKGFDVTNIKVTPAKSLILYDYKTAHSKWFEYAKTRPLSHYHRHQLGTYMYMLRKMGETHKYREASFPEYDGKTFNYKDHDLRELTEARRLAISKDDLRLHEQQLLWTPDLEKDVVGYWRTLNGYWNKKIIPKCTCGDYEKNSKTGIGFMALEKWNPYYANGEPCSLEYAKEFLPEGWK